MKATDMVQKIVQHMDQEKQVFGYLYDRDGEGNVLKVTKIPLENVFAYSDTVKLCFEKSQSIVVSD